MHIEMDKKEIMLQKKLRKDNKNIKAKTESTHNFISLKYLETEEKIVQQNASIQTIFEEMEYYEAGDIVFARHEDYIWPSKVIKPLNNYTLYQILLLEAKIYINFTFNDLMDYNQANRQRCLDLFNNRERDKNSKQKLMSALRLGDIYYDEFKRREEKEKFEELIKKNNQIEEELQRQRQQQNEERKIDHGFRGLEYPPKGQMAEKESKLLGPILKESDRRAKYSKKSQFQKPQWTTNKYKLGVNRQESKGVKKTLFSPKQSSQQPQITIKDDNQQLKYKKQIGQSIITRERENEKNTQKQFAFFPITRSNFKDIGPTSRKLRLSHELDEDDKEMILFVSRYEYYFEEMERHLQALSNVSQQIRVKICENSIDKIFRALTQRNYEYKIVNFLPLLKVIFGGELISLEKLVSSNIIGRLILFILNYEQLRPNILKLQYEYIRGVCKEMWNQYIIRDECEMPLKCKLQELFKKIKLHD